MNRWTAMLALLLAVGVGLSACTAQPRPDLQAPMPAPSLEKALAQFAYEPNPFTVDAEVVEQYPTYDVLRVTFPAYFQDDPDNTQVIAWYYRQKTKQRRAGIVQIPILGGDYGPSKMFATRYAREGFHVLRFERKSEIFVPANGLAHTRRVIISTVIDLRRGLDWWSEQPEVDAHRIGLSGISFGGFMASIMMAVDDRPAAATLMLNGGDFATLVVTSQEEEVIEAREGFMKLKGWDEQTLYRNAAAMYAEIDPIVLAPRIKPQKVLFVSPKFDQVVPYYLATRWWEAAGKPHRITLPTGHFSSVYFLFYIQDRCVEHFRRVFGYRE
ncbi:MAG: prolyl oligopeptidase family serine peptidase [Candidatus Lernaella stagnicola]|nr:prolyl oligopeptidase family serine peptidase [Candidatus Lernaella stagnicola]